MSRDGGITHSADNGKHVVSLTDAGIALKTAVKVAMQADKGMDLKGALAVNGKITSRCQSAAACSAACSPAAWGARRHPCDLGVLSAAGGPSEGFQRASYIITAAWVR